MTRPRHRGLFLFLAKWVQKGVGTVGKLIRRMVSCGIPKKTAFRIWRDFERRGKREALLRYIEVIENV